MYEASDDLDHGFATIGNSVKAHYVVILHLCCTSWFS